MIDQFGNEISSMTKEEAEASVEEMGKMVEYFEETCEKCGEKRMNCGEDCFSDWSRAGVAEW